MLNRNLADRISPAVALLLLPSCLQGAVLLPGRAGSAAAPSVTQCLTWSSSVRFPFTLLLLLLPPAACRKQSCWQCCGASCRVMLYLAYLSAYNLLPSACRKQSCYPGVLAVLRRQLAAPCYSQVRVQLAAMVAPERSSVFDQVLY